MTYEQAVEYLFHIPKFAKKTTKEHLLAVLERLDNPHLATKSIHVAGTNGKGSTCAYMSSILQKAGFSVGMFTSPHLVWVEERFRINEKPVEKEKFLECFHRSYEAVKAYEKEGNPHLSFFEMLFVIGTLIFREEPLDYVIYETGLGGRLDATNVLQPELVVITSIGLDHMEYLGDTIEQIAYEKAGIIKEKTPVIYFKDENGGAVLEKEGKRKKAKRITIEKSKIKLEKKDKKTIDFSFQYDYSNYKGLQIPTTGLYQVENAILAILSVKYLYPNISKRMIQDGLLAMKWHCRMEEVEQGIFIDGAHNEPAISRFMESIESWDGEKGLIFGVVSDKDYKSMIKHLMEKELFSFIILTSINSDRAVSIEEVKRQFYEYKISDILVVDKSEQAFKIGRKWKNTKENRTLFCTGSLYLAGELYQIVKKGSGIND